MEKSKRNNSLSQSERSQFRMTKKFHKGVKDIDKITINKWIHGEIYNVNNLFTFFEDKKYEVKNENY